MSQISGESGSPTNIDVNRYRGMMGAIFSKHVQFAQGNDGRNWNVWWHEGGKQRQLHDGFKLDHFNDGIEYWRFDDGEIGPAQMSQATKDSLRGIAGSESFHAKAKSSLGSS